MNNYELKRLIPPVTLIEITIDNLRVIFNKEYAHTPVLDLDLNNIASLHNRVKSFVCKGTRDGVPISVSTLIHNIAFAYEAEDEMHIITINVPSDNDAEIEDAEFILVAKKDGIFKVCDINEDGVAIEASGIKEIFFAF